MRYHIRRFTMYKSPTRGYIVEVYNPNRDKKHRTYRRLGFERICKLCRLFDKMVDAQYAEMSIVPGRSSMSVEVEVG